MLFNLDQVTSFLIHCHMKRAHLCGQDHYNSLFPRQPQFMPVSNIIVNSSLLLYKYMYENNSYSHPVHGVLLIYQPLYSFFNWGIIALHSHYTFSFCFMWSLKQPYEIYKYLYHPQYTDERASFETYQPSFSIASGSYQTLTEYFLYSKHFINVNSIN